MLEKEGITMVQHRGARILMSGKESTWYNTERIIQKLSLCGTHPQTLTRRRISPKAKGQQKRGGHRI
jgi:hypothetical protein